MSNERIAFVRARDLTRVGDGGGVDSEDITVHAVPRAEAPAWLMCKQAEGFELDLKPVSYTHLDVYKRQA